MRAGLKVLTGVLAIIGLGMVALMVIGILQWVFIGAVIVGIIYAAFKFARAGRRPIGAGDPDLHRKLRTLEKDLGGHKNFNSASLTGRRKK
jgi:hypothetical protein